MAPCGKLKLPGETEAVLAGEQPAKGYPGQAHQTMGTGRAWQAIGVTPLLKNIHRMIDLPCLKKRTPKWAATTKRSGLEKSAIVQFPLNRDSSCFTPSPWVTVKKTRKDFMCIEVRITRPITRKGINRTQCSPSEAIVTFGAMSLQGKVTSSSLLLLRNMALHLNSDSSPASKELSLFTSLL